MDTQEAPLSPATNPNEDENLITRNNDFDDEKTATFASQLLNHQLEKTPKFIFNSLSIPTQIPPTNSQNAGHSRSDSLQLGMSNISEHHTQADPYNKYLHLTSFTKELHENSISARLKDIDPQYGRYRTHEIEARRLSELHHPERRLSYLSQTKKKPRTTLSEIHDREIGPITEEHSSNLKIIPSNSSKHEDTAYSSPPLSITRSKAATQSHRKDQHGFIKNLNLPQQAHHHRHSEFLPRTSWMKANDKAKIVNAVKPRKSIMNYFKKAESVEDETSQKALEIIRDKAFVPPELSRSSPRRRTQRRDTVPKLVSLMRKHASSAGHVSTDDDLKFFKLMRHVKSLRKGILHKIKGYLSGAFERIKSKFTLSQDQITKLVTPFHPAGAFRICWDILVMIWIVYSMILYPFRLSFEDALEHTEKTFDYIDNIINIFFFIDICLNFHTAYYQDGTLVFDQKKIVKNYLKGWFIIDLIATIPYEWIDGDIWDNDHPSSEDASLIKGLRLLKLVRVFRVYKVKQFVGGLPDFIYNKPSIHGILSLIKLCLIISFLAHWCACGWQYVVSHSEGSTWYDNTPSNGDTVIGSRYRDQYIASLYFAMTTMLTVGFGDITPTNSTERVYTIFMMLLGGGIFGYAMNRIAIILQSLEDEKSKLRKKISSMTRFLQKKGFGRDVQQEVVKYLEFVHEDNTMNQNEKEMFNILSQDLKDKLYEHMNGRLLYENKVMCSNFSRKLLYLVSSKIEAQTYAPGEEIFNTADSEFSIYFIIKGQLEMFFPKSETAWLSLKKESHFGEFSFFTQSPRTFQAKSVDFSHLIFLRRDKFLESLELFPHDREAFCMLKDKLLLYQDFSVLKLKCGACEKTDHILEMCPQLRYIPDKEFVIRDFLENQEKNRINFARRYRNKFHSRLCMPLLVHAQTYIEKAYPLQLDEIDKQNEISEPQDVGEEISINQQLVSKSQTGFDTATKAKFVMRSIGKLLTVYSERDKSVSKSFVKHLTRTMKLYNQTLGEADLLKDLEMPHDLKILEDSILEGLPEEFEFDRIMNFPVYFPHHNFTKIMDKMNKKGKVPLENIEDGAKLKRHLRRFFKAYDKDKGSKVPSRTQLSDSEISPRKHKDIPKFEIIISS